MSTLSEKVRLALPSSADIEMFQRLWDGGAAYAIATVVHTEGLTAVKAGARAVIQADGALIGALGGGCVRSALQDAAQEAMASNKPALIYIRPDANEEAGPESALSHAKALPNHCPSGGRIGVFIEPIAPAEPLVVFGDSDLAHWVSQFGAAIGLRVQSAQAFDWNASGADKRLKNGFIVVATRGQGDGAALNQALASACPAILFVSSRKKAEHWRAKLAGAGVAEARHSAFALSGRARLWRERRGGDRHLDHCRNHPTPPRQRLPAARLARVFHENYRREYHSCRSGNRLARA